MNKRILFGFVVMVVSNFTVYAQSKPIVGRLGNDKRKAKAMATEENPQMSLVATICCVALLFTSIGILSWWALESVKIDDAASKNGTGKRLY